MGWAAIIAALVQFFGPLVADWLKKCSEKKATDVAEQMPDVDTFASEHEARDALFDQVIEKLPRRAFVRRAFARRMKAVAAKNGITSQGGEPLSEEDVKELTGLADAAAEE